MFDTQQRQIRYLRISLTKACQMRCTYCRPTWLRDCNRPDELNAEADLLACRLRPATSYGFPVRSCIESCSCNNCISLTLSDEHKVRLTGGDPSARLDLLDIIERLARIDGVHDLAMTTNGLPLAKTACDLKRAGLGRVNVSLDSLDAARFERMTGWQVKTTASCPSWFGSRHATTLRFDSSN